MDCDVQVEFGSPEYLGRAFGNARAARVPMNGVFDLTYRCNFGCVHCYVGHLVGRPGRAAGEIDTEQAVRLLREAADAGCLMMLLTGGEPLLRPDFLDIYTAAKRLGMIVTVFTNASLVNGRHVQVFADLPPHSVEVSIYGATETTYERVTGAPGSFGRARRGIELLLEGGVHVVLKTMILRDNMHEVPAMEDYAKELGVQFRLDPLITPRLDGDLSPLEHRVAPDVAAAIELSTPRRREDLAGLLHAKRVPGGSAGGMSADRVFRCGAGLSGFSIDPQGRVHPCSMSRTIAFDALGAGFVEAWRRVVSAVDEATWEGRPECSGCSKIFICGYCAALFELEGATAANPPEYVCRLGESRYSLVGEM